MTIKLERSYYIDGELHRDTDLETSLDGTKYLVNGEFYTQEQLEEISSSSMIFYSINGHRYTSKTLKNCLRLMGKTSESTIEIYGQTRTREEIEEALSLPIDFAPTSPPSHSGAQKILSSESVETPPVSEDEETDELAAKMIANLSLKTQAAKRHKKVLAKVEKLRKLLAECEADLVECERVMALEAENVQSEDSSVS